MGRIFIVRNQAGEMISFQLGGKKVVPVFEEKLMAESYCDNLNSQGNNNQIEIIGDDELTKHLLPKLRALQVEAVTFNLIPGESPNLETYTVDIANPNNPRTYDFSIKRWLTAKESHKYRKDHRS